MPMMEAKELIQMYPEDQGRIQDDQLLFRILSGTSRIQWEMGVCCYTQQCTRELFYINKLQLILATFNLSSNTNLTLQFCFCSDSCLTCGRSCSKSNHHQDDSQKTHWRLTMSWCVIPHYLSVIIVSALNKTACYLMMFSLPGLVFHWPYLDNSLIL